MNTIEYLKAAKRRLVIESDYALAQRLELTRSAVSKMQLGHNGMSDETAVKIAGILKLSPAMVLADAHAEREKNPEIQAIWRGMVEKFSMGFESLISHATPRRRRLSAW
jgi:hypothetical protein